MKILIIRHAEPDYSVDSLTEKGFCEAELLSQFLMSLNISDVYCSTMGRAQATAKPFLEKSGLSAENCDWLREFGGKLAVEDDLPFGDVTGKVGNRMCDIVVRHG